MVFNSIIKHKKAKQFIVLYSSTIIGLFLGIGVSVLNTRLLGPEDFGNFKYITNIYSFFSLIISFGYFISIGRLMVKRGNESIKNELIGSGIILTLIMGVIFSFSIIVFSFFQKYISSTDLQMVLLALSPFMFLIPFKMSYEYLFQGSNQIYELAFFRESPKLFYILAMLLFSLFFNMNVISATIIELLCFGLVVLLVTFRLKPKFINVRKNIVIINEENKIYGNHVYLGSLFGVASTHFGPIVLSYFSSSNIDVGYFSLASVITMPLVMIPNVVGTTMFTEFAKRKKISSKILIITFSISFTALVFYFLFSRILVNILYGEDYYAAIPLIYINAVGSVFHGYGNFFNRFLGAHGQGKKIRNGSILVGAANLLGYVTLIPLFGVYGASYSKLLSGGVYVLSMFVFYFKYSKKLINESKQI